MFGLESLGYARAQRPQVTASMSAVMESNTYVGTRDSGREDEDRCRVRADIIGRTTIDLRGQVSRDEERRERRGDPGRSVARMATSFGADAR